MNTLIYTLVGVVMLSEWATALGIGPRALSWAPEIISGFIVVVVALRIAADRSVIIPRKYIILFSIMFVLIAMGIATNTVQSGAVFAGLRTYFRYAPVFLLPMVYYFSDEQIRRQLKFVLALALVQLPIAIYQKLYAANPSGDLVTGTVGGSGPLSIFLICTMAMMTAFLVKGKIRLMFYAPVIVLLFIPTTINETTVTFFLMPLAFVLPVLLTPTSHSRFRQLVPVAAVGALVMVVFVTVYNAQYGDRWHGESGNETGLGYMLSSGEWLSSAYRGANADTTVEEGKDRRSAVGRLDAVILPFKVVSDPVRWMLGNGIGNVSISFNELLQGDYSSEAELYGADFTAVGKLLWEIGVIGLILSFLFFWFVFKDARAVSARDDIPGVIALGWAATIPILAAAMFYTNLVDKTVLGYLMWYLSGYIISKRCQQYYQANNRMGVMMNKSNFQIERTAPQPGIRPARDFSLSRERRNQKRTSTNQ
jgi:hypothetical protein